MSLYNELPAPVRTFRPGPDAVYLVEGDWNGERSVALGFANHPQVILAKAQLAGLPSVDAWIRSSAGHESAPLTADDNAFYALMDDVSAQLTMTAEDGYTWVAAVAASGDDAYRPEEERLTVWVIRQLQRAAKA